MPEYRGSYKNPSQAGVIPHSDPFWNNVWFVMKPYKVESQQTLARGGNIGGINIDWAGTYGLPQFMFIAPNDIIETTTHNWGEYDSVLSRLGQKAAEVLKAINEGKGIATGLQTAYKTAVSGGDWENIASRIASGLISGIQAGSQVYNFRLDTPLVYTGSERRSLELTFNLVEEGNGGMDIIEPVKVLQELSCAKQKTTVSGVIDEVDTGNSFESMVGIEIPYIWNVMTFPVTWIDMRYAALRTVQPTFRGPFIDGYPSSCELLLSFQALEPLYAKQYRQDLNAVITHNNLTNLVGGD